MIQILDSMPKKPKFLDQLMSGVQNAGQQLPGLLGNMAENKALSRLTGQDVSGLSPELKNTYLSKLMSKKAEDTQTKQNAVNSIGEMREIISSGKTGWLGGFGPESRGARAALDTSALNLEKLAADMVGRGTLSKQRFEYLKQRLPSGWKTDAENHAILDQWEKILGEAEMGSQSIEKMGKQKFSKEHPEHRKKAEQLNKRFKGDRAKVRKELEREFEF